MGYIWRYRSRILMVTPCLFIMAQVNQEAPGRNSLNVALVRAVQQRDLLKVQNLLALGADANMRDKYGWPAVMMAVQERHSGIVHVLVVHGGEVNARNQEGRTALMLAAERGYTDIVHVLLDLGANINAKSRSGQTALMLATRSGSLPMVMLYRQSAPISNTDQMEPRWETFRKDLWEIVQVLLERGAEVNAQDREGGTALLAAAGQGHLNIVQVLLARGVNVNARNKQGKTALLSAIQGGHSAVAQVIAEHGAEVNVTDVHGTTPLICAARVGRARVIKLLLAHGAHVNATDQGGKTALIWACQQEVPEIHGSGITEEDLTYWSWPPIMDVPPGAYPAIVTMLLAQGAKVEVKDKAGNTALKSVLRRGDQNIARLLKEAGAKE